MADLREKIEAECENIESALRELPSHTELKRLTPLELAGVGFLLASSYNGIENIIKQVLREKGIAIPDGATWHRDLLNLAVIQSVISERTKNSLARFLAFRHFFSHAYVFDLDPARLQPLVNKLSEVYRECLDDIRSRLNE